MWAWVQRRFGVFELKSFFSDSRVTRGSAGALWTRPKGPNVHPRGVTPRPTSCRMNPACGGPKHSDHALA